MQICSIVTLPHKGVPHLSRSNIEMKVRSIVETFTMESSCGLPPLPLEVKINGLYVLLLETNIVMDRKQLEKQKDTMAPFMKLETNGILSNMFISTFG